MNYNLDPLLRSNKFINVAIHDFYQMEFFMNASKIHKQFSVVQLKRPYYVEPKKLITFSEFIAIKIVEFSFEWIPFN